MLPCDARGGYDFLPERPPRDSARGTSTVTARPADEATLAAARPRARLHSSQSITSEAAAIDEYVPVDGLVASAQGLAVAAMRFCGVRD